MTSAWLHRGPWLARLVALVAIVVAGGRAGVADEPTRAQHQALADDQTKPWYEREKGIRALAEDYDPPVLVPWLRERLDREKDFHARLAFAFALASQGEKEALSVLVDSLSQMGHFGYVYLTELGGAAFGGPGKGWDKPAWDRWLPTVDATAWRELQRLRHLPRVPADADEAGLSRAAAWWDTLGYPDVAALPFVRVLRDSWTDAYGFLLAEQPEGFTVFTTDLVQRRYPRECKVRSWKERFRVVRSDLARTAQAALGLVPREKPAGQDDDLAEMDPDELGTDRRPHRVVKGFVLARALLAQGKQDTARAVWCEIAKEPGDDHRYGSWSCFDLVQRSAAHASLLAWQEEARLPERSWKQALEAFRVHRRRFDLTGDLATREERLARMAEEESGYAAAGASDVKELAVRARDLIRGLPTVARELWDWDGLLLRETSYGQPTEEKPSDALERLVALGYEAVPALRDALRDERPTKSLAYFSGFTKGWIRHDPRHLEVRDLARLAFLRLTDRDFCNADAPGGCGWPEVLSGIDAWCVVYAERGERGVLEAGVLARDRVSGRDAQRLVRRFPETALATIRSAAAEAPPDVLASLLGALAPLTTSEAWAFLQRHIDGGPFAVRMAAARALFAQGQPEGLDRLRAVWPSVGARPEDTWDDLLDSLERPPERVDLGALVELFLTLDPGPSLEHLRATLPAVTRGARHEVLSHVHRALGYREGGHPPEPGSAPVPEHVERAAEALVVALVLPPPAPASGAGEPLDAQEVGERAAKTAAWLWPARYRWDAAKDDDEKQTPARTRLLQRHAIVNAWRESVGEPPLAAPVFSVIPPAPPKESRARIGAWLAVEPGTAEWSRAADQVVELGLGVLPALREARAALEPSDVRLRAFDGMLLRRASLILRETAWTATSLQPSPELTAFLERSRGSPVSGLWIVDLLGVFARSAPPGTNRFDVALVRPGDDTGVVATIDLSATTALGKGNTSGWTLVSGGWEHVDAGTWSVEHTWWHDARASTFAKNFEVPDTKEIKARWTLTRIRSP